MSEETRRMVAFAAIGFTVCAGFIGIIRVQHAKIRALETKITPIAKWCKYKYDFRECKDFLAGKY